MIEINKLQQARIGLAVSICILLLILYIVSSINFKNREASGRAQKSSYILHKIEEISTEVHRLESAQRGFIITHDSTFIPPYRQLTFKVAADMRELKELVKGDRVQSENVAALHKLMAQRIVILEMNM